MTYLKKLISNHKSNLSKVHYLCYSLLTLFGAPHQVVKILQVNIEFICIW